MADWIGWFIAAGVLVVLEMFIGTFYLLMVAIGLLAGGVAALLGISGPVQTIVAAAAGMLAAALLYRTRFRHPSRHDARRDRNVHLDIGEHVTVPAWDVHGYARVMYRGAPWDVELGRGATALPGEFRIVAVKGSRLVVANAAAHS